LARPAQRYLIYIVPFWAILIHLNMVINKYYKWIYVLILCTLNLVSIVYQVENGTASNEIAEWAIQEKLFIDSGDIHPHVGNFPYHKDGSDLLVVNKTNSDQIVFYTKSVKVFGYPLKQYYVVTRQ